MILPTGTGRVWNRRLRCRNATYAIVSPSMHLNKSLKCRWITLLVLPGILATERAACAAEQVVTEKLHHLRSGAVREWADFPEQAETAELRLTFQSRVNA